MLTLHDRIKARVQTQICPVCVNAVVDGSCSLSAAGDSCPILLHLDGIIEAVAGASSERMDPYVERLRDIVCGNCVNNDNGGCHVRDHLDCPLDLYFPLVVAIVEDEISRQGQPEQTVVQQL